MLIQFTAYYKPVVRSESNRIFSKYDWQFFVAVDGLVQKSIPRRYHSTVEAKQGTSPV